MVLERFFDDLEVGMTFTSPSGELTADDIVTFAQQFDPQYFHTDPQAAKASAFGQLVASGWHTAAFTMRLLVASDFRPAGGSVGAGVELLRWPRPVLPGDVLHVQIEVIELRVSRSKPDRGIVKLRVLTRNAADDVVQELVISSIVPRKIDPGA